MRGATAKALRRQARAATEGAPAAQLMRHNKTHVIFHSLESTRGYYKRLKRIHKKGR